MTTLHTIDFAILDWIQANLKCDFLDSLMPKITLLGEKGIFLIIVALLLLFWKGRRGWGIALLLGLGTGALITNCVLKILVARPRPCWINTSVELLVQMPTDYSFPSGHAQACFLAATILFQMDKRFGIPALILAAAVSFSRLYLYVHFLSDVIAGAILGVFIGLATVWLIRRIWPRLSGHDLK